MLLSTGYRMMGDWIVYDVAWDETVEELVSNSTN